MNNPPFVKEIVKYSLTHLMSVSVFSLIFLVRIRNKMKQNRGNVKICNLSDNLRQLERET